MDDFGRRLIGRIYSVELPPIGSQVVCGEGCWRIAHAAGEVLYLPEMVEKTFAAMARQDEDRALSLAADLTLSLRSLAQLGISREMIEKAKGSTAPPQKTEISPCHARIKSATRTSSLPLRPSSNACLD